MIFWNDRDMEYRRAVWKSKITLYVSLLGMSASIVAWSVL